MSKILKEKRVNAPFTLLTFTTSSTPLRHAFLMKGVLTSTAQITFHIGNGMEITVLRAK